MRFLFKEDTVFIKTFFRLYFGLLIPLNILFIIASIIYFNNDYNLTKSLRLGVLSGFFIALAVSFATTILLLIMRWAKKMEEESRIKKHQAILNSMRKKP